MKVDILVLTAHPDDSELTCSGTILAHIAQGKRVGIVDLTQGELGTRGTPQLRKMEAEDAARILGLSFRENLGLPDGFFRNDRAHQLEVVKTIRRFQPDIILTNSVSDRHPDHGRAAALVEDASFLAGLRKVETLYKDAPQQAWRPRQVYHFIQDRYLKPDLIVDVSPFWSKKMEAIKAFRSQFYDPENAEPLTYISQSGFLEFIEARALELGHYIGVQYGEGFTTTKHIGVNSFFDLL